MKSHGKNLRVLMVEDSPDDEELVRLVLVAAGYTPALMRVATRAAIEACLTEAEWNLILCDHNLPNLDSLDVLQIVTDHGITTPFVILSGFIADDLAIKAMRRGARDFIHKDSLGKLIPVIEREQTTVSMTKALNRLTSNPLHLSDFDRLTGLPNRDGLLHYLSQRTAASLSTETPFGLLLMDINRFRNISQLLGPSAGNQVVAEIARRIAAADNAFDFFARIGGDSFALVAPCPGGEASVKALVAALNARINQPMRIGEHELFITLSMGGCCFPTDATCAETLFTHAEAALFSAKHVVGTSYRLFHPSMTGTGARGITIEGALHRALQNREFVLYYQPQINLASGTVVSVEALLRWQHPEWGLVSPGEFIPLLEATGLIMPVGEWIIDNACAQLRVWDDSGLPPLRMAVNLSALQFDDPRLTDVVTEALRRNAIAPERLELEITESIVMQGREEAITALQALRQLGVRIAVDDFGTGYSSLGYLKRFPITTLKIDQMFVRECADNLQDQALVETMIDMAHRLNLEVVAEGVETEPQARFLAQHGCEFVQGYLYGKPVPAEELAQHLQSTTSCSAPTKLGRITPLLEYAT